MAGIVSLASAVARNATQMLPLIATGACARASPVLARVGRLERALLQQAAVSDAWAGAREVAERTAAIALERERVVKGALEGSLNRKKMTLKQMRGRGHGRWLER
eukprot:775640-Pelagomonas_calceolata.AAC.1